MTRQLKEMLADQHRGQAGKGLGVQQSRLELALILLPGCVTMNKTNDLSEPLLPHW
jgi:hypothetical protein